MSAIGMVVHRYVSCWTGNKSYPPNLHLFDGSVPTLVFTEAPHAPLPNVEYLPVSDYRRNVLPEIMETLYTRGLQSLLVEGGSQTLQSFIAAGLWDEIFVEETPYLLHSGAKHPKSVTDIHLQQSIFRQEFSPLYCLKKQSIASFQGFFIEKKGGYYL